MRCVQCNRGLDRNGRICQCCGGEWSQCSGCYEVIKVGTTRHMTWDEFIREFKPVKNHLDPHASQDGYMFETGGPELGFVLGQNRKDPRKVWTLFDDGEGQVIREGYGLVNRMGYFVTEMPAGAGCQYLVDEYIFETEAQ